LVRCDEMIETKKLIQYYSIIALIINILALILNLLSYFGVSLLNLLSVLLFLTAFFMNIALIALDFRLVNKSDQNGGRWIKNVCWMYIFGLLIAIFLLGFAPFLYSFMNITTVMPKILAYCIIFGVGAVLTILNINTVKSADAWL